MNGTAHTLYIYVRSASVCVLGKVTDEDKLPEAIKRLNFAVIAFLNTLQGDTECKM